MECHKYKAVTRIQDSEDRLYIPNRGVLNYSANNSNINPSFSDDNTSIKTAEKIIGGAFTNMFVYLGKTNLPSDKINELIESAKAKGKADKNFQEKANSLISLIK